MSDGQFETLIQRCAGERGAAYVSARDQILVLGTAAVELVEAKSQEPDWQIRTAAEILLGWLTHRPLFEEVVPDTRAAWLEHEPATPITGRLPAARRAAILAARGSAIVPRLIEIVTKTDEYASGDELQAIMLALDYLRDPRAVMPLAELTRTSTDEGLQTLALATLGQLADPQAFDVARAVFANRDRGPVVRSVAAVCLGQLGDPRAAQALLAAAQDARQASIFRAGAIRGLGYLGETSAGPVLATVLRETSDERLALSAVDALAQLGNDPAIETLEEIARGHSQVSVRRAAQDAREGLPA